MLIFPIAILAIEDSGDRAFMEALYVEYQRLMIYQARKILRNQSDAEDAVGEALVSLIGKIQLLRRFPRPVLRAYVVSTIRNTSLNYSKLRNRRSASGTHLDDELWERIADPSQDVEAAILNDESIMRMEKMIGQLNEREAEILRQKYFLDMSDHDIAIAWDAKPETIRKAIYRARKHLMALYARGVDE